VRASTRAYGAADGRSGCGCRLQLSQHPVSTAIPNLAVTYSALGRHQDILVMGEKALEFRQRVLPENHPEIGASCVNCLFFWENVDDLHRALQFAREALRIQYLRRRRRRRILTSGRRKSSCADMRSRTIPPVVWCLLSWFAIVAARL
jgi:hypothetical protein